MGSGAMIYIPSFIKIGLGVQKLIGGGDAQTHTHRQQRNIISPLYSYQNKDSRLKRSEPVNVCSINV
jgi:hypothetical protein